MVDACTFLNSKLIQANTLLLGKDFVITWLLLEVMYVSLVTGSLKFKLQSFCHLLWLACMDLGVVGGHCV